MYASMPEKDDIINRLVQNSAEIITDEEFRQRLESGKPLTHYIGFEISGYVHLGTGIMSALVMKDLADLGVKCTVWLADWHTLINDKLDGRLETAQTIGRGYFTEALKASYMAVGGNPDDLEFRLASEWYNKDWSSYWQTVIQVSKHTTLSRMMRSVDILGRESGPEMDHAKTMYPSMQVADIFYQSLDIVHAGMDQRKAHVIMRDVGNKVRPIEQKPIAIHHPLLIGLQKPHRWPIPSGISEKEVILEMKMSKSDPKSAIWVHDSPEELEAKIMKAFCPEREVQYNPVLNWTKHVLFWNRAQPFRIDRKPEHGGTVEFETYTNLETVYAEGRVHPMDLKSTIAREFIDLLAPVRAHFARPSIAAAKAKLDRVLTAARL